MAIPAEKLARKKVDPVASSKGKAGVLPDIENIEAAFQPLDEQMSREMEEEYHKGREKGQTTNNPLLDPYFKWMPGYTNIITGWSTHGKSKFFFELLLIRALYDGLGSIIWPSENLPAKRFYHGLIHTMTGRSADLGVPKENRLSLTEYKRAQDFIKQHFLVLNPPNGHPFTPAHILQYFTKGMGLLPVPVAHCMLDPWNKADHTAKYKHFGGSDEAYVGHNMGMCTTWSQDTKQSLIITAHPKRGSDEQMAYGKPRPVPTGGMISGGQMWENAPHYIGAVHRPFKDIPGSTEAAFYCLKCKDEGLVADIGCIGANSLNENDPFTALNFDKPTNRYLWGRDRSTPLDFPAFREIWQDKDTPALPAAMQTGGSVVSPEVSPKLGTLTLPPLTVQSDFDQLPDDFHPHGKIIRLL